MKRVMLETVIGCCVSILSLAGCSSGGGSTDGGHGVECGPTYCAASQSCIHEAVCVSKPSRPALACTEDDNNVYSCQGDADFSCHNAAACTVDTDCPVDHAGVQLVCRQGLCGTTPPAGPTTVTYRGCVDAFGIGDVTDVMRVALYRADQDPTGNSTWDVATTQDKAGCEYWGAFEFTDVPTNTPLIVKTYDPEGSFITTYKYNLVLWADLAADQGGTFVFDTRNNAVNDPRTGLTTTLHPWRGYAISQPTFNVIMLAVDISSLPADQGGIAGTIRDCQYREAQHVKCGVWQEATAFTYFTNASKPQPTDSLDATNVNGLYAAIGLPEGQHTVACTAQNSQGEEVLLGIYSVRVFGQAVTILNMDWYPAL